jgi:hypothetical protein
MAFKIGERVVCVDADDTNEWGFVELSAGQVYQIRWVGRFDWTGYPLVPPHARDVICVRLVGVNRNDGDDPPFRASRFRPLIERKTSTGFEILDEIRKRESVDETTRAPVRATV